MSSRARPPSAPRILPRRPPSPSPSLGQDDRTTSMIMRGRHVSGDDGAVEAVNMKAIVGDELGQGATGGAPERTTMGRGGSRAYSATPVAGGSHKLATWEAEEPLSGGKWWPAPARLGHQRCCTARVDGGGKRRWAHRRGGFVTGGTGWSKPPPPGLGPAAGVGTKKSEWWAVDGEMHEIGDGVPHRERFAIPRDNLPNRRRKQMREQFMRRTRLVLKDSEHETWCKKYMELYQELRENWERLYWDEGYSKKIAESHANYDSAQEDDLDFSPYR
ncbi:unnamed protein product [Miscanthus lutarioriparius]|uniref:Uncharacterized protein n=1 Tax=Miscanthus lutarioriparius TaxID=422564 RepID=A0A811PQU4_9POAL|nr:unnamed protein product [Miscanthus lutarioriparius]